MSAIWCRKIKERRRPSGQPHDSFLVSNSLPATKVPAKKLGPKASRPHMPGYGLPKGNKGLLPWKWADDRLKKSHNYWITTVKPGGSPHPMIV